MKSVLKIHTRDKLSWLIVPSIILFSSFFVNYVISLTLTDTEIYTGGVLSIFINVFLIGLMVVAQTFPYALGMSIRRIDFFIGTSLMGLTASIVIGFIIYLLAQIEVHTAGWGSELHFFHLPYLNDGTSLEQIMIYIILLTFLFFSGMTISSFFRRFGGKGMLILSFTALLIGSIALILINYNEAWAPIFAWVASHTAIQLALWLTPFTFIYMVISYGFIRRATI
ncbi:hypothetical protein F7731_21520 [Cytobacillus depressus]|uniref:Uncharacterized protein n=1 Tax=Cytobacillus depressus TaxID=1602942 RepID=A0A6L3UZ99_9BACI|nr:hypothetical protein [Cytobacillus depressus]KAB2329728.1 hypothetical protein F7731_21520 [Cytobacillus depressus]